MKVKILAVNRLELRPETDAEEAILDVIVEPGRKVLVSRGHWRSGYGRFPCIMAGLTFEAPEEGKSVAGHHCQPKLPRGTDPGAVAYCYERDGEFWVDNNKADTRVNFCPFCGAKAPKQVDYGEAADGD